MACPSSCVGNCCTNSCSAGCSSACRGGCVGSNTCGGGCSNGCKGGCTSKGGCGGNCEGSCSVTCGSGVDGSSGGGGCGCGGNCSGKCEDNCAHDCSGSCNNQCDGKVQDTNIADMGDTLHKKFLKSDISNITKCIEHEAKRRGKTPDSVSFNKGEKLDDEKINKIISNLEKAGQTLSISEEQKKKGLYSLGQTLIDKAIAAYEETVDYEALGITVPDDIYKSIIPLN